MEYQHFLNIFIEILNKHGPLKQKYLRANHGGFVTKDLYKVIMKCSRLRNKFLCKKDKNTSKRIQQATTLLRKPLEKSQKTNILQILM